jgi:hypothetical protein
MYKNPALAQDFLLLLTTFLSDHVLDIKQVESLQDCLNLNV